MRRLREETPGLYHYHLMLHAALVCLMLWKAVRGQWGHAGLCLLTLLLFSAPALWEKITALRVPPLLELCLTLFALCANMGGEMLGFYLRFPWWDAVLHVLWGFLAGLMGCSLLSALQGQTLRPLAGALTALAFAALTGICWEFFEYFMDSVFSMDMQKDAWLSAVSSVLLDPEGRNAAFTVPAQSVTVNGEIWPGFLDPGLRDTVSDLFQSFLGSVVCALALLLEGRRGSLRLLRALTPAPFPHRKG